MSEHPQRASPRALFDTGSEDARRACKLYPNQGLHPVARAWAVCHPRAIQYLEAAPVLAVGLPPIPSNQRRRMAAIVQGRVWRFCEDGAPLKMVMRSFGLAPPLRRLTGFALSPFAYPVLQRLSRLPAAELGNLIPVRASHQRWWLSALTAWGSHLAARHCDGNVHFGWAARELAKLSPQVSDLFGGDTEIPGSVPRRAIALVADMADFASVSGCAFNPAWGWPRAKQEMDRWHSMLTIDRAVKGTPFQPDDRLDFGAHPDEVAEGGYVFLALRTPRELVEEGVAMHHCVASYLNDVVNGRCHIVAVRRGGRRVATVELDPATWRVRQQRGPYNATINMPEHGAIQTYAVGLEAVLNDARQAQVWRMSRGLPPGPGGWTP